MASAQDNSPGERNISKDVYWRYVWEELDLIYRGQCYSKVTSREELDVLFDFLMILRQHRCLATSHSHVVAFIKRSSKFANNHCTL